jgi:uncharacterized membrane protein
VKKNTFSIKEALSFGWETFSKNIWYFLALFLGLSVIFSILGFVGEIAKQVRPVLFVTLNLISVVLNVIISIGLIKMALSFVHNKKASIRQSFTPSAESFFPYIIGSFLYILIILGGTMLLIIPGIIWALTYQFYAYFIVDKNYSPREALRQSARITKGAKAKLFGFLILIGILNIIGALLFGIGLLVTIPVTILAIAFTYQKLSFNVESNNALERLDPSEHKEPIFS